MASIPNPFALRIIRLKKQLIRKLKSTKQLVKPITFFYGILTNKFKELYLEQMLENSNERTPFRYVLETGEVMFYDWLHVNQA